jgi:serine/threonine protein kinase
MSPEQARGKRVTVLTDVYAFGIVLYEMLVGEAPFSATSWDAVLLKQMNEPPPPVREHRPEVPKALEAIVLRTLEKDPARRPQSMDEVIRALRLVPAVETTTTVDSAVSHDSGDAAGSRRTPLRRVFIGSSAVLVAAIVAGVVFVSTGSRREGQPGRSELAPNVPAVVGAVPIPAPAEKPEPDTRDPATTDSLILADFFLDRGQYDEAIAELEAASKRTPRDAEVLAALEKARIAGAVQQLHRGR